MPKLDPARHPVIATTGYPPPHDGPVAGRSRIDLALAGGLTQYGANLVTLAPGAWSSQRHWHTQEDELVVMLSGALVLIEDGGETEMHPGDIATFKAGTANAHHLVNRSKDPASFLAVGTDRPETDECHYPDIGMHWSEKGGYTLEPQNS